MPKICSKKPWLAARSRVGNSMKLGLAITDSGAECRCFDRADAISVSDFAHGEGARLQSLGLEIRFGRVLRGLGLAAHHPYDMRLPSLDPERATERPGGIVRFRTVVIHENGVEAAITKEGAAEFSDLGRCFHPTRRFRIELSKFLQLSIFLFRQKLNAHGGGQTKGALFWFMFFP